MAVTGEMMDMSIGAFSLIVVVDVKHDTRAFTLLCSLHVDAAVAVVVAIVCANCYAKVHAKWIALAWPHV